MEQREKRGVWLKVTLLITVKVWIWMISYVLSHFAVKNLFTKDLIIINLFTKDLIIIFPGL